MPHSRLIDVLLVDDHAVVREGLRALLCLQKDIRIVAETASGAEAFSLAQEHQPQVVIMDIALPDLSGIEVTRQLMDLRPRPHVLALSIHTDHRFLTGMLAAGSEGYLPKDCAVEELISAVRTVALGHTYIGKRLQGAVIENLIGKIHQPPQAGGSALSPRELEVLCLLSRGKSVKAIGELLCISPKTVETHRQHIMQKLDLHSIAELTRYAIRQGLTPLEE